MFTLSEFKGQVKVGGTKKRSSGYTRKSLRIGVSLRDGLKKVKRR